MRRQGLALRSRLRRCFGANRIGNCFRSSLRGLQLFQFKLKLSQLNYGLLALAPEAPPQQLLQNVLHALQASLVRVQLRSQIDHHLPQHVGVVRQCVGIDLHNNNYTFCCGSNKEQNALEPNVY